jgi:hypothetical protein
MFFLQIEAKCKQTTPRLRLPDVYSLLAIGSAFPPQQSEQRLAYLKRLEEERRSVVLTILIDLFVVRVCGVVRVNHLVHASQSRVISAAPVVGHNVLMGAHVYVYLRRRVCMCGSRGIRLLRLFCYLGNSVCRPPPARRHTVLQSRFSLGTSGRRARHGG